MLPVTSVVVWPLIIPVNTHVVGEEGINKETNQLNVRSELPKPRASVSDGTSAVPVLFNVEIITSITGLGTRTVVGGEEQ